MSKQRPLTGGTVSTVTGYEHEAHATLGTRWVVTGEGATGRWLADAVRGAPVKLQYLKSHHRAFVHAKALPRGRTNLALTGRPLTAADLERIARCEVKR